MDFINIILNLDRRIIYGIVAICVAFPLIRPVPMPIVPTPETRGVYDMIDSLPEGSSILIAADFDPASKPELLPMLHAVIAHCFAKGVKPHLLTLWASGPGLVQNAVEAEARDYGKVSGQDYAFLGFRYGTLAVILGMASSVTNTFSTDFYGRPTASMPIYQDVRKISDFKYILDIAAGATVETWIAYASEPQKVPMGASVTAVSATQYYPYLQAQQLTGLVGGMKGSAEYEELVSAAYDYPMSKREATKGMAAQSFVHLFIVLSIILANACYFVWMKREREQRRSA